MKILILSFLATVAFSSVALANEMSCERVIESHAIDRFKSFANGPSLKKELLTIATSEKSILYKGTLVSYNVNVPSETTVYITAKRILDTCVDIKFYFPTVAD